MLEGVREGVLEGDRERERDLTTEILDIRQETALHWGDTGDRTKKATMSAGERKFCYLCTARPRGFSWPSRAWNVSIVQS